MYYHLLSSVKRRIILELQDSFSRHPVYAKIVDSIQDRFSFDVRPQYGIVVKGSSANKVNLSADNYIGRVQSHVMLAYVGAPAYPLEWVREDLNRVRGNRGVFPSMPGVYYIEILAAPTPTEPGAFVVDPLITAYDEAVLMVSDGSSPTELQLQQVPVEGTLRLWEGNTLLLEGRDYTVEDARVLLTSGPVPAPDVRYVADYRYAAPSVGPIPFLWNTADTDTIPGAVLAFGKRAKVGDKVAVVVYPDRVDTADAYGGKFDVSMDLDVLAANDISQMEEIVDLAVMYMWGEKRPHLSFEGIEITDVSIGGEAEEAYDENADTYYYTASISMQIQTDWEMHKPLPLTFSRVTDASEESDAASPCDRTQESRIQQVYGNLFYATEPISVNRNNDFERIR